MLMAGADFELSSQIPQLWANERYRRSHLPWHPHTPIP